ncbi:hypothetical protein [Halobellus sp. GM3]|uniref:hypothetical protein n=1 Tax=Halobellus sp. GM3 TaxID=3458410 RepID=UPI00403DE935
MVDARTLAAAVLGVALGLVFVVAPETVLQVHTAGRLPRDRHGRYGDDGTGHRGASRDGAPHGGTDGGDAPAAVSQWRRLVQLVGVALVLGGLYFAWTLV